jgi:hypothetical protein
MIIESEYRGYRIEVVAVPARRAWDANVWIRRAPGTTAACVGRLACKTPTAKLAEQRAVARARTWIDQHGQS